LEGMANENAKILLQSAGTFAERVEAIKAALSMGMPLREIEAYLDWLDGANEERKEAAKD
jgi:hypothetical protein